KCSLLFIQPTSWEVRLVEACAVLTGWPVSSALWASFLVRRGLGRRRLGRPSSNTRLKTTMLSYMLCTIWFNYHPTYLTVFITKYCQKVYRVSTKNLAIALRQQHSGSFKIIRPRADYIIICCSTANQVAKYLEINTIAGVKVDRHRAMKKMPTRTNINNEKITPPTTKQ
ncbi:hypothetical protein CHS0354_017495, partial [Potamilus streckersoni]